MYKITITDMDAADLGDSACGNTIEGNAEGYVLLRLNSEKDGFLLEGRSAGMLPNGLVDEIQAFLELHARCCRNGGESNV